MVRKSAILLRTSYLSLTLEKRSRNYAPKKKTPLDTKIPGNAYTKETLPLQKVRKEITKLSLLKRAITYTSIAKLKRKSKQKKAIKLLPKYTKHHGKT